MTTTRSMDRTTLPVFTKKRKHISTYTVLIMYSLRLNIIAVRTILVISIPLIILMS